MYTKRNNMLYCFKYVSIFHHHKKQLNKRKIYKPFSRYVNFNDYHNNNNSNNNKSTNNNNNNSNNNNNDNNNNKSLFEIN